MGNTRRDDLFLDEALNAAHYDQWWWPIDPVRTRDDWGIPNR